MAKPAVKKDKFTSFVSGGAAGLVESVCCHPLDTIKTRMQLRGTARAHKGPYQTAVGIVTKEGFFSLYKGLTAVSTGIVPKMAIRFWSFEAYKQALGVEPGNSGGTFVAGIMSGFTEAILIVTPFEVCKIRMQGQMNSMSDPNDPATRKYRNVVQTAYTVVKEEGALALWKGVGPTLLRQGINQGVNFTAYHAIKARLTEWNGKDLAPWQHFFIGGFSGGMGPCANCPLDVVKTRMQKQVVIPGETAKYRNIPQAIGLIAKEEGVLALWRGLGPRLMRIVPGQAITFMVYEKVSAWVIRARGMD